MAASVYVDANVVIGAVEGAGDDARRLSALLETFACVSSELTLAETLVGVLRLPGAAAPETPAGSLVRDYIRLFEAGSLLTVAPVTRSTLISAAHLRAEVSSLKLPDAVHLATALTMHCDVLVSGDRKLCAAARTRVTVCSLDPEELDALAVRVTPKP